MHIYIPLGIADPSLKKNSRRAWQCHAAEDTEMEFIETEEAEIHEKE